MSHGYFPDTIEGGNYPRRCFKLKHAVLRHPLLALENLAAVAARLPREQVEYNLGDLGVGQSAKSAPLNGLSAPETVARIEECRSWMVMKNVEILPEYRALMDACLDELWRKLPPSLDDLHLRESFVFVSSPGSVTPFHIDPEHNFLLQVRGRKTIRIWSPEDREVLPDSAIERTVGGGDVTRSVPYREAFDTRTTEVALAPGEGVYVPFHAPHWVGNGDQVSISYSITFRSAFSRRRSAVHVFNKRLRRLGITPAEVGKYPRRDDMKYAAYRGYRRMRSLLF